MLGFLKRISREFNDPYTYKKLYVDFVRPGLEYLYIVRVVASSRGSFGED
jgi:hypothetical protein